jgi:hypothetical protein
MTKNKILQLSFLGLIISLAFSMPAMAQDRVVTLIKEADVTRGQRINGFTFAGPDNNFSLVFPAGLLNRDNNVKVFQRDQSLFTYPQGYEAISDVLEYNINKGFASDGKLTLAFRNLDGSKNPKTIFYWNETKWDALPTQVNPALIKADFNKKSGKVVVLTNKNLLQFGTASWYKYKGCDCAASPDYPKGTKLLVTNLDNNQSVVVKVNDYGPDRSIFPDRIIDLDKVAFAKLGKLSRGVLKNIKVEKYE